MCTRLRSLGRALSFACKFPRARKPVRGTTRFAVCSLFRRIIWKSTPGCGWPNDTFWCPSSPLRSEAVGRSSAAVRAGRTRLSPLHAVGYAVHRQDQGQSRGPGHVGVFRRQSDADCRLRVARLPDCRVRVHEWRGPLSMEMDLMINMKTYPIKRPHPLKWPSLKSRPCGIGAYIK